MPGPTRSASFGPKRPPPGDAGGRAREREVPAAPSRRPRSAQARPLGPAARGAGGARGDPEQERVLQALHAQCRELKSTANTVNEDNLKMRTRIMALERELQRREKLLQQMLKLNKAGQGFGMDIIEKLREERNMLPIYRRKAQELQAQIDAKDAEIRALKRDPQFTRIIELQVQFASWQHEAKRLDSLLQEPSVDDNEAAKHEVEVHERRVERLEEELEKAKEKQEGLSGKLADAEAEHAEWEAKYRESEAELSRQQEETRKLAASYKDLLQQRHEAERLESEIQQMTLSKRQYEAEVKKLRGSGSGLSPSAGSRPSRTVSHAALAGPLPPVPASVLPLFWALRRACGRLSADASLFAQCLRREVAPGLLSPDGLAGALEAVGCPHPPAEVAGALVQWLPSASADPRGVRWLDLLAALDRLGSATGSSPVAVPPLPDVRPLRAACVRRGISSDDLRARFLDATTHARARSLFSDLGLSDACAAEWLDAWIAHGPSGLLLRLPLSEAAMSEAAYKAWMSRCTDAVRLHKRELIESFKVWRDDMALEENQFRIVMVDVVGAELSEDDIDDLMLWAGGNATEGGSGSESINGKEVLKLSER